MAYDVPMAPADPLPRLSLYHYDGCFYCARVRQTIEELGLPVELRNIYSDPGRMEELEAARGRRTVPVLRIEEEGAEPRWMPESRDIVRYLRNLAGHDDKPGWTERILGSFGL